MASAISTMVERLYQQQAALERRVAERTSDLASANEQLVVRLGELREAQQRLIVADRRLAIGKLALGVAHEINNPLAYVMANLDHVLETVDEVEHGRGAALPCQQAPLQDILDSLRDARDGAERVRRIVQKLQETSHGDSDARVALDLRAVLDRAIRMALNEIKHRAQLVTSLEATPLVVASELQLGQVFLNLLVNAAQAIVHAAPSSNLVRIACRSDERGWAVVEVSDTGKGIEAEIMDRIFDPFFTTKDIGQGMGLGLSICHGIVTAHGGTIGVTSQVGKGSTFTVTLPPAPPDATIAPPQAARTPLAATLDHPRLRLLLVEDDPLVATALRRVLKRTHDVEIAQGGRAALARLRGVESFDAIVCDLMMPDFNGMELHAALERERPALACRVVFVSGGAFTEDARRFVARHHNVTLRKPVDVPLLLERIRAVVEVG